MRKGTAGKKSAGAWRTGWRLLYPSVSLQLFPARPIKNEQVETEYGILSGTDDPLRYGEN
ncbi:uncharacterized protein N7500_010768 [Penicillium coprophilum]|uniref:uncharacterized protein n=1 Tax=Penicillium coprophilum TaxID=36646 RepID=UPI00239CAA9F|nr:uncharacterized protein N7500_010768 [Penicillium coprophilum]KAJ5150579.1 hypothetical protein N7500_010768 [Penicillium coprophilum]